MECRGKDNIPPLHPSRWTAIFYYRTTSNVTGVGFKCNGKDRVAYKIQDVYCSLVPLPEGGMVRKEA
jgi:hypothetical protein